MGCITRKGGSIMRNGPLGFVLPIAAATLTVACGPRDVNVNLSYAKDVEPILMKKCSGCHAPGQQGFTASGLDTTSHAALMKGSRYGAVVKPGDEFTSARSLLFTGDSHGRQHLSDEEFEKFKVWVCEGAKNN